MVRESWFVEEAARQQVDPSIVSIGSGSTATRVVIRRATEEQALEPLTDDDWTILATVIDDHR